MTLFSESTKKILMPAVVLAVLILSIALFFYAAAPVAAELPFVGWLLLALVVLGALCYGGLAWETATRKPASKPAARDLATSDIMMFMFQAFTVAAAVLGTFAWLAPVMGLPAVLVVPFALGLVSIVAVLLDLLSKTGRLTQRWRGIEVGSSVVVIFSTITALFYLALAT